jgi:hypothetical protein
MENIVSASVRLQYLSKNHPKILNVERIAREAIVCSAESVSKIDVDTDYPYMIIFIYRNIAMSTIITHVK